MLRVLLESNAPRQRRRGSTAASIVVHTVIIAGAIAATASARTDGGVPRREPGKVYVLRPPPPRQPTSSDRPHRPTAPRAAGRLPVLPMAPEIPPFNPFGPPKPLGEIDPTKLLVWGDSSSDRDGRRIDATGITGPTRPVGDEPATYATVERPAALLARPRPRYPEVLRSAGVTGRVVVRLVVDTTGRVEAASVVVRESSHDLFSQAVRAVLPSLRFSAAEVGGRKVRMLVDLPFEFRLNE